MSLAVPASPVTIRKSSCRPISAGTAVRRSRMKSGGVPVMAVFAVIARLSELLGADQLLGQQHGDRLAALKDHRQRGLGRRHDLLGALDAQTDDPHRPQHRFDRLAHRELPRIALAEIAAHADKGEEREAPALDQRQHVDAIADAARLYY